MIMAHKEVGADVKPMDDIPLLLYRLKKSTYDDVTNGKRHVEGKNAA
jgi:hypothetical protein